MIHFFRRIRQKLLTEGRLSKYLIYALGEIALVMIGILLAFQINSWNDKRIQNQEEVTALRDLKVEFESNLTQVEQMIAYKTNMTQLWESYISTISNQNLSEKERSIPRPRMGSFLFAVTTPALHSILSTGKIDRIQNDSLKQIIIEWENISNRERTPENLQHEFVQKTFIQLEMSLSPNETLSSITGTFNPFYSSAQLEQYRLKAAQNLEYQNALLYNHHLLKIQVNAANNLKKLHQQVIRLLDQELNHRK